MVTDSPIRKGIDHEDINELEMAVCSLKLLRHKGSGVLCSHCKRTGWFGSICTYEVESGNVYVLCGWCGSIIKQRGKNND